MPAVNEPTVVLASAETKFLGPVVTGDRLEAEAEVERTDGRKAMNVEAEDARR